MWKGKVVKWGIGMRDARGQVHPSAHPPGIALPASFVSKSGRKEKNRPGLLNIVRYLSKTSGNQWEILWY